MRPYSYRQSDSSDQLFVTENILLTATRVSQGFPLKLEPAIHEAIHWLEFGMKGMANAEVSENLYFTGRQLEAARSAVADALGCHADEVTLNEAAGVGINLIANGINWNTGDVVVTFQNEHPSNRVPWFALAQRRGIEIATVADELHGTQHDNPQPVPNSQLLADLDQLLATLGQRAKLLSFSHVSRRTGVRLPAKDIVTVAHKHSIPVLIDGAQAFGSIPVDVKDIGCDYYTVNGHKYCMAPTGTGACYIAREKLDSVLPSWVGCHGEVIGSDASVETFELLPSARRFEFGNRNISDHAGWRKSLEIWRDEVGWNNLFAAIAELTGYIKDSLQALEGVTVSTPRAYDESSTIVAFAVEGLRGEKIVQWCQDRNILIAAHLDKAVRISAHAYNTREEVDRLVTALRELQVATAEAEAEPAVSRL